ncbi:glycoside hydrolase superfamily [Neurospora tetraspora]|uniref:Glycoside hydrolase superfamily n=1 Tax=Neurospora tetraspora TaxID=94610 RepID=A0AAE0MKG3_9PEZI|nr:glycoside hydrolase superfamily [Neurospora tetraspora]
MRATEIIAGAAALLASGVSAEAYLGFNSGNTLADRSAKFKKDWVQEFTTAQNLKNAPGTFNAVRLYTNIQAYSQTSEPIEAFEAAIETNTKILLGVWASGTDTIEPEIKALQTAISTYGKKLTDLIIGASIGSEDLYRVSVTGIQNKSGVGAGPSEIVKFIGDWKKAFQGTAIANVPIGHVDTWDVWVNGTNKPVIDAVDWVGVDEYPYYENGKGNNIENSGYLFDRAFDAIGSAVGDKPVWVTETGWPYVGQTWDQAEATVKNQQFYWQEVGCRKLFGKVPTFWYNLRDSNPDNEMKFAITDNLSTTPHFDLTCPSTFKTTPKASSSGAKSTSTATGTGVSAPSSSASGSSSPEAEKSGSTSSPSSSEPVTATVPAESSVATGSATSVKGVSAAAVAGMTLLVGVFAML